MNVKTFRDNGEKDFSNVIFSISSKDFGLVFFLYDVLTYL